MNLLNITKNLLHLAQTEFRSGNSATTSDEILAAERLFEVLNSVKGGMDHIPKQKRYGSASRRNPSPKQSQGENLFSPKWKECKAEWFIHISLLEEKWKRHREISKGETAEFFDFNQIFNQKISLISLIGLIKEINRKNQINREINQNQEWFLCFLFDISIILLHYSNI
jgi:hypothetical protein